MTMDVLPAPLSVPATAQYQRDDSQGIWSTFHASFGTPPQAFRVSVSTISQISWIFTPESCISASDPTPISPKECASLSGAVNTTSQPNHGFNASLSSTYLDLGQFMFAVGDVDGTGDTSTIYGSLYNDNATYGTDVLGIQSTSNVSTTATVLLGIPLDYYTFLMGGIGLAPGTTSAEPKGEKTLIESLFQNQSIPSRSWAYSAGASYRKCCRQRLDPLLTRFNKGGSQPGSLVLGGYDESRLSSPLSSASTFTLSASQTVPMVNVTSLSLQYGATERSVDLVEESASFTAIIDSTLPYLYLPDTICDALAERLGLIYDDFNDLYTVNDTQRATNLNSVDTLKLQLSDALGGTAATSITFNFRALDMSTSWPILNANNTSEGFIPIRKARKTPILGRTFFQEAYVIMDYDRRNFTVMQTRYDDPAPPETLVGMYNSTYMSLADYTRSVSPNGQNQSGSPDRRSLSGSAVAGIVTGVLVFGLACGIAFWVIRRRKRTRKAPTIALREHFDDDKFTNLHEVHEAPSDVPAELEQPLPELPQHLPELEGLTPELDTINSNVHLKGIPYRT